MASPVAPPNLADPYTKAFVNDLTMFATFGASATPSVTAPLAKLPVNKDSPRYPIPDYISLTCLWNGVVSLIIFPKSVSS